MQYRVVRTGRRGQAKLRQIGIGIFFGGENESKRWKKAVLDWISEIDLKKIRLPVQFRGDFETGLEELSRVANLYVNLARGLGRDYIADVALQAEGCIKYGVAPELVPLRALHLRELGRARARALYESGIRMLDDLAGTDPIRFSGRHIPQNLLNEWIICARNIQEERNKLKNITPEKRDTLLDELVSRFSIDAEMLPEMHQWN
jgi:replicative superfamily II helicase